MLTLSTFEVYPTPEDMKAKTNAVTEVTEELFANGKTFKVLKDKKLCFNKLTLYTDAAPVTSDPNPYNERIESKEGKIIVAVSDIAVNDVRKVVKNGNPIKNSYASKILKASYKKSTGAIELKSGSKSGNVKLWVVNVSSAKEIIGFTTVNVKVNSEVKSVRVYKRNTDGDPEGPVIKEVILKVGEQKELVVIGSTDTKGNVKADKAAYILGWKITPDFKSTVNDFLYSPIQYRTYSSDDIVTDDIDICGISTINGKVIKSTATLTCIQSGKKAKIKVNVINPVEDITVTELTKNDDSSVTDTFCRKNDIAVFRITEDTPAARYEAAEGDGSVADTITTDKLKIYVAKPQDDKAGVEPFTVKNGKIVYEKSKAVNAKYDDGMLTLTRRDPDEAAEIWFAYTDPITKEIKTWKVVDVTANDYSATGMGDAIAVTA